MKASIVVEAANMPVTHGADDALHALGVVVVPDILANAGGVIASYFEWAQNLKVSFPGREIWCWAGSKNVLGACMSAWRRPPRTIRP